MVIHRVRVEPRKEAPVAIGTIAGRITGMSEADFRKAEIPTGPRYYVIGTAGTNTPTRCSATQMIRVLGQERRRVAGRRASIYQRLMQHFK